MLSLDGLIAIESLSSDSSRQADCKHRNELRLRRGKSQAREEAEKSTARLKFLQNMTEAEREHCRKFVSGAKRTVWLNAEDGVVAELVRRGVIYCATGVTHFDTRFEAMGTDFTMSDWAWDYLHEHPDSLAILVLAARKKSKDRI